MPRRLSFTRLSFEAQPLVFLTSAFIGGLLLASGSSVSLRAWMIASVAFLVIALLCRIVRADERMVAVLLLAGCAAGGGMLWRLNEAGVSNNSVRKLIEHNELSVTEPVELWGTLTTAPELAPDRLYLSIEVEKVSSLLKDLTASGRVQIVVSFNDAEARREYDALALDYGTRIRVLANLMNPHGYRNPGAPNFDEMLEFRGYDASASIKSPLLIERLSDENPLTRAGHFERLLAHLRAHAITAILRSFKQPTAGILAAALFGSRHFLSRDTAEAFREGGTFHLLVISGLHVALIAWVVLLLTKWLSGFRLLRYALVMALMWSYALMVGAQPSITRAVVMLNLVIVAQLIFRASIGANTLAATALALLAWQPRDLFNASFHLSFLTVLMIVAAAVPLMTRLKHIGAWQPSALTPYPPRVPVPVRWFAEVIFWNEAAFQQEMKLAPIHYRLEKAHAARWLSSSRAGRGAQWCLASVTGTLAITISVQVGLLPLMIAHFHRVSLVAPLANVFGSLLMFALMIAGGAYLFIYVFSAGLALKLAGVINALGWLTARAANPLSQWRGAILRVPDYSAMTARILYLLYFLLILLLIVALNQWNPLAKKEKVKSARMDIARRALVCASAGLLVALLVILAWHPFAHQYEAGQLSVTFLDVGQGDAIFISFPRGATMLLDSGGHLPMPQSGDADNADEIFIEDRIGIAEAAVAPFLWNRGIKRLDLIALSHSDTDHSGGFVELARSFGIGAALVGMIPAADHQFEPLQQALEKAHVPLQIVQRGNGFELDGVRVEALAPFSDETDAPRYSNNQSLVLRLTYGSRTFLFTGDIERKVEEQLLAAGENLRADVLKVAHHGSRTSSTEEFLRRVAPQYAVISVAAPSPFGHPHPEVMERLLHLKATTNARILQTSACGAITISTDGRDLKVGTLVRCEAAGQAGDKVLRSSGER